jgi:hypothetical protein
VVGERTRVTFCLYDTVTAILMTGSPCAPTTSVATLMPQLRLLVAGNVQQPPGFDPMSCDIYDGQRASWAGFPRLLGFSLPVLMPSTAPHLVMTLSPTLYGLGIESVLK